MAERKVEKIVIVTEAPKGASACMAKYKDPDGTFKGGKGEAFDNCVKAFRECRPDVDDPEAMCAHIGRQAGKIK